ncbi:nitroreductase/quinone reductase family protein [Streptomonospora algeriensis]|uniref:Nitroreductase/quinone reductase family protein n=1 Tax=Streptomonospora algeriensis TaxID=995084 RepID=A0ABW3BBM7_9ACTN
MTERKDIVAWTIREFRANRGRVGGPFAGAPTLLLRSRGARSGLERTTPMMYLADGPRYPVFASKAGADRNPDRYHNLLARPAATIEVGDEHIPVTATELHGPERDRHFAEQARRFPGFAGYQRKTRRVIPVVALTPATAEVSRPHSGRAVDSPGPQGLQS